VDVICYVGTYVHSRYLVGLEKFNGVVAEFIIISTFFLSIDCPDY